jgi:hypothetical protein
MMILICIFLKVTKLPNGLTVASIENYSPISHVAVIVNAGSRMESADDIGVSHALRAAAALVCTHNYWMFINNQLLCSE